MLGSILLTFDGSSHKLSAVRNRTAYLEVYTGLHSSKCRKETKHWLLFHNYAVITWQQQIFKSVQLFQPSTQKT